jgi:tetratricopeptide (TPR) repeat protein
LNNRGDVYRSIGIPGTGLYDVERTSGKARAAARAQQAALDLPPLTKVGLFAPAYLKAFAKIVADLSPEKFEQFAQQYPDHALAPELFSTTLLVSKADTFDKGAALLAKCWQSREAIQKDDLFLKFYEGIHISVPITPGIVVPMVYSMKALGLIYAEVLQAQKKYSEALEILETLDADIHVQIATAEVEVQLGKYDEVIHTTEGVSNHDDASAVLLVFRGIAMREEGMLEAALEEFKLVIATPSRDQAIRNKALFERALTYQKLKKDVLARKDWEKILVTDGAYEGVKEKLAELKPE